jgi:protease-4
MSLTPDQIIDRVQLKKRMMHWRLFAIISFIFFIFSLFAAKEIQTVPVIEGDYIARIFVEGMILDDFDRTTKLKDISEDKRIKGVIIHINSPGGTVVGGESLFNSLRKISASKPIVAVMGDVAASAAYMTAIASDYVIARQGTITGSIGVIAQSYEFTELAEKAGVKFHNFKSSPLKGGPIPTEPLSPEMKASMDERIADIYEMFVDMVASRRPLPKQRVYELANGSTYTGRQAIKIGLIDELGDEDAAVNWLRNIKKVPDTLKVRDYSIEKEDSRIDRFLDATNNLSISIKSLLNNSLMYFF